MPQYRLKARVAAERLEAQSAATPPEVLEYLQRASNYVLCVVLFASALFFAGISTKLTAPTVARRDALARLRRLPGHRDLDRDVADQR